MDNAFLKPVPVVSGRPAPPIVILNEVKNLSIASRSTLNIDPSRAPSIASTAKN